MSNDLNFFHKMYMAFCLFVCSMAIITMMLVSEVYSQEPKCADTTKFLTALNKEGELIFSGADQNGNHFMTFVKDRSGEWINVLSIKDKNITCIMATGFRHIIAQPEFGDPA